MSSRTSRHDAGWDHPDKKPYGTHWERLMEARTRTRIGNFSWFSPAPLLASVNDVIAKGLDDVVTVHRRGWMAAQRGVRGDDLRIGVRPTGVPGAGPVHDLREPRFLILGDPGEQDASQYAVVAPMLSVCDGGSPTGSDFLLLASDVIYPAGDVNDYIDGFYLPFEDYKPPILAIPGNHDWYDGLNGFMYHFTGAEPLPPTSYRAGSYTFQGRMARRLWRKASCPAVDELARHRGERHSSSTPWVAQQPGPYFAIETEPLLVVCIDTGITGTLDREQGDWLRRVSADPRPKILVTGKPIYTNNEYHPGPIAEGGTVDDVVRDPGHGYVAVIGGDIHNYQRYTVTVQDGPGNVQGGPARQIEYVTAGGGGAYLSATHRIGAVDIHHWSTPHPLPPTVQAVTEDDFRCYPLRGDSLARFTQRSMLALYALVVAAVAALALGSFWLLPAWDDPRGGLADGAPLSRVMLVAALSLLFVPVAVGLGVALRRFGRMLGFVAPRGYATFFSTMTTLVVGGLLVALVEWWADASWALTWPVAVTTVGVAIVPALLMLLAYLTREIGPTFTRTLALALALMAAGLAALGVDPASATGDDASIVALRVVAGLAVLLVLTLLLRRLTRRRRGWLTFLWGLLPVVAVLLLLEGPVLSWPDLGRSAAAIGLLAALGFLAWWWRAVVALVLCCRPAKDLDPDQAVRFVADRLGVPVERAGAADAKVGLRQRRLARVLWSTRWAGAFISEAAEATRPPFFKSFLKLEVVDRMLVVTAHGVTGYVGDEDAPAIEDRFEIALPVPAAEPVPAVGGLTVHARGESGDGRFEVSWSFRPPP